MLYTCNVLLYDVPEFAPKHHYLGLSSDQENDRPIYKSNKSKKKKRKLLYIFPRCLTVFEVFSL